MRPFIETIFGDALGPDRRLCIFTTPDLQADFFADAGQAAACARELAATRDVYFGVGLVRGQPAGRGKAEDVAAIGALWADVDLADPVHQGKPLPASVDDVRNMLARLPHAPSMLVHSGHGVHAYWLLKEPWVFEDDAEREQGARLAKGWHGTVCAAAQALGWHLENLGDLARVLRLPGTLNHKTAPSVEVRVIESADARYNPTDFEPYLVNEPAPPAPAEAGALVLRPDAAPPVEKMMAAAEGSPKFRDTWARRRPDLADQSQSGYDLALASIAARLGWTDQEIADLVIAARRRHNQNPAKALRRDYIARTLTRARTSEDEPAREAPDVDISAIVAKSADRDEAPKDDSDLSDGDPIPEHLLRVPGFIAETADYSLATAKYGQPSLSFAAALALQALLAGRKIRDESDTRTNLYVLALANSGVGKDHPRKINQRILLEAGLDNCFGEYFASGEGIEDRLLTTPAVLFQTDEIDALVLAIAKGHDPRWEGIMSVLLRFYSNSGSVYPMRVKAGQSAGTIDQPLLCLLGTAIPTNYYGAMSSKMLTNGFFARMLVLEAGPRQRGGGKVRMPLPPRLVQTARWWVDFQPGRSGGNLKAWHPEPAWVEATPEAEEALEALRDQADAEYGKAEKAGDVTSMAVWARAYEKARKLALLYAASERPQDPKVSVAGATWASEFILYLTRQMLDRAARHVAETEFHARCNRLLEVLSEWRRQKGDAWMPFWRINRKLPWSERDHDDVRATLKNMERIEYLEEPTGGTPKRLYRLR